jgi:hypothetical protein
MGWTASAIVVSLQSPFALERACAASPTALVAPLSRKNAAILDVMSRPHAQHAAVLLSLSRLLVLQDVVQTTACCATGSLLRR